MHMLSLHVALHACACSRPAMHTHGMQGRVLCYLLTHLCKYASALLFTIPSTSFVDSFPLTLLTHPHPLFTHQPAHPLPTHPPITTTTGAKVVFLRPRPQPRPPKGVAAPARCMVDGRQLMDGSARYCSLQCKLEGEDAAYAPRHALATARAQVTAAQLNSELLAASAAGGPGAAAVAADAAAAGGAAAGTSDQAHCVLVVPGKRAAGLMRFEGTEDDSGDDGDDADQGGLEGGRATAAGEEPPRWGARGKRQRAASVGVALAAAAARGGAPHPAAHHHAHSAGAVLGAAAGAARAAAAENAPRGTPLVASPASSHDSGRSSTCRWHAKRRKGEPMRAPLQ